MRSIFTALIALIFTFQTTAFAAKPSQAAMEKEAWQFYLAHLVAYQPRNVGAEAYLTSLGLQPHLAPGKELFREAKKVKEWPTFSIEKDALKISGKEGTILMERTADGKIQWNGRTVSLDATKPLLPQWKKFFAGEKTTAGLWFVSAAHADEAGKDVFFAGALVSGVGGYGVALLAAHAGAGGVAGGALLAGAAGIVGSAVCGIAVGTGAVKGSGIGNRFLNCLTKPFSLAGVNPRDRMYLEPVKNNIKCNDKNIVITAVSSTGNKEKRTFHYDQKAGVNLLQRIQLESEEGGIELNTNMYGDSIYSGTTRAGKQLTRPKNTKELNGAQDLVRDFNYLIRLCGDPERLKLANKTIETQEESVRVYDANTPDGLTNSAE